MTSSAAVDVTAFAFPHHLATAPFGRSYTARCNSFAFIEPFLLSLHIMMENYRPICSQMRKRRRNGVFLLVTSLALSDGLVQRPSRLTRLQVSNIKDEIVKKSEVLAPEDDYQEQKRGMGDYLLEKMGSVDESRVVESTANAPVSALISSTLLMGASQTLGWVVLPAALQQTGLAAGAFSLSASCMYSGIASMLLAEYCLNAQIQDESLVRIYQADSNPGIQRVGIASFFFLQYFLLIGLLGLNPAVLVPTTVGLALGSLRQLQQGMQIGYVAILVSILGLMAPELGALDWTTLLDGDAQHPDQVQCLWRNCLFLASVACVWYSDSQRGYCLDACAEHCCHCCFNVQHIFQLARRMEECIGRHTNY